MEFRGRLQVDVPLSAPEGSTTEARRLYVGVEGESGAFSYVAEIDVSSVDEHEVSLQDVTIEWQLSQPLQLVAGHFRPPVTSDDLTSDLHTLFTERSAYAVLFTMGRRWGVAADYLIEADGRGFGIRAGGYGATGSEMMKEDFRNVSTAAVRVHADLLAGEPVFHLGVAGAVSGAPLPGGFRFSRRPETLFGPNAIDTGFIPGKRQWITAVEAGYQNGPFLVQAEGGRMEIDSSLPENPVFSGWSAQVAWRPTGEARQYNQRSGVFGKVKPRNPVGSAGIGAFELAGRYSHVDFDDGLVRGGILKTVTAGASWFPVDYLRFSVNWVHALTQHHGQPEKADNIATMRAQVEW